MIDIDLILAKGLYVDRRGTLWEMCRVASCERVGDWWSYCGPDETDRHITADQMRLLIERDQHRDVCPGLGDCSRHPVPMVIMGDHVDDEGPFYMAIKSRSPFGKWSHDHAEAMDFARALAVTS